MRLCFHTLHIIFAANLLGTPKEAFGITVELQKNQNLEISQTYGNIAFLKQVTFHYPLFFCKFSWSNLDSSIALMAKCIWFLMSFLVGLNARSKTSGKECFNSSAILLFNICSAFSNNILYKLWDKRINSLGHTHSSSSMGIPLWAAFVGRDM